ncbi:MAG: hypothetical protein ABIN61_01020 [candidate division WOR-3 bacterium]
MKRLLLLLTVFSPIWFLRAAEVELLEDEVAIEGEVIEIEEVLSPESEVRTLQAKIRTQDEEMVEAHLGPGWFLNEELVVGERVRLYGKFEGYRLKVRIMIKNEHRYAFRNERYEPLWVRTRLHERRYVYDPRKEKKIKGKIEFLYIDGKALKFEALIRVKERERVRVQLGPEWFLRNKIRCGDEIEVRGSEVDFDGGKLLLVREMRNLRNREEVTLRNREGFPEWVGEELRNRVRTQEREGSRVGEMQKKRTEEKIHKGKGK